MKSDYTTLFKFMIAAVAPAVETSVRKYSQQYGLLLSLLKLSGLSP